MPESQQKSSTPQNINEYLEDSEKFLESMMDETTPTKEEFEELLHKYTDTPTPPETTSSAPVLPRLLNFDDTEVSPLLPRPPPPPPPQRTRVELTVKILETKTRPFKIEMNLDDTVLQLKESIYKKKRRRTITPSEMSVRLKSDQELNDQLMLRDCGMLTISTIFIRKKSSKLLLAPSLSQHRSNSRLHPQRISLVAGADSSDSPQRISQMVVADSSISGLHPQQISPVVTVDSSMSRLHPQRIVPAADDVNSHLRPQQILPVAAAHSSSGSQPQRTSSVATADPILGAKMLNVFVVPKGGTQKIQMKINVFNRVEKLRDELERFHKHVVPEKGRYFFIYQNKGYVMTETYAFNWYQMKDGDTIEITPESRRHAKPNSKK